MKIEVYDSKDNLIREIDCIGPEASNEWDGTNTIDVYGRCQGCNDEPNYDDVRCYKKGSRLWFVDPATLGVNNDWSLDDFTIKSDTKRIKK